MNKYSNELEKIIEEDKKRLNKFNVDLLIKTTNKAPFKTELMIVLLTLTSFLGGVIVTVSCLELSKVIEKPLTGK